MGQAITVELPDSGYLAVQEAAAATGNSPAEWIAVQIPSLLLGGSGKALRSDLPDEIVALLQQIAPQMKRTAEELTTEWLTKYGSQPRRLLNEQEQKAARERLQQHFGAVNLGYPTGADNESIDADLAHATARHYRGAHHRPSF
jgi:predicted exporter